MGFSASSSAYKLSEFNRANARALRKSIVLYLVTLSIAWLAASLALENSTASLFITLLFLLLAHAFRVVQLRKGFNSNLTALQRVLVGLMALAAALLLIFAYSQTVGNGSRFSWVVFRSVFLSVALATWLSAYLDFALAELITAIRKR